VNIRGKILLFIASLSLFAGGALVEAVGAKPTTSPTQLNAGVSEDLEVSGSLGIRDDVVGEGGSTTNYCGYNEVMNGKIIYANFYGYIPQYFGPGWYQCVWNGNSNLAGAVTTCEGCSDYTHVLYNHGGYGEPYYGPAWIKIG
jgi:hypothetical protein